MQKESIILTNEEKENIIKNNKFIGSGMDGNLYKVGPNVYKFYKNDDTYLDTKKEGIYDSEGVNIQNYKQLRNKINNKDNRIFNFFDKDGVILAREDAILKAVETSGNVKKTYLPNHIIYEKNNNRKKAIGCVYPYYKNTIGIYASAYLPLRQRLMICKELIGKVSELLDNNVYPITLAQRSDIFPVSKSESNILLGLNLRPYIVDLDGNSTFYTEEYSHYYTSLVLSSLSTLVMEIISKIKIYDDHVLNDTVCTDEIVSSYVSNYINELINEFSKVGIPEKLTQKYFEYGKLEMNDIKKLIKSVEKKH